MRLALNLSLWMMCFGLLTVQPAWNYAEGIKGFAPQAESTSNGFTSPSKSASFETPSDTNPLSSASDPVNVTLISEENNILPGRPFWIGVHIKMDANWHTYWKNPGHAGMAPAITWQLPAGFTVENMLWPTPKRFSLSSMVGFGYEDDLVLLTQITPSSTYAPGKIDIGADVRWLACSDSSCLPGESSATLKLSIGNDEPIKNPEQIAFFNHARALIPKKIIGLTAERKNNLIELSFSEKAFIKKADFFPEHKSAIDFTTDPLFQTHPNQRRQHTIILNESTPLASLKGILVLQTSEGTKSFDVNVPITDLHGKTEIVMNDSQNETLDDSLFERPDQDQLADISFEFEGGLALALVLAFIGGMILNLMPCVLPVISFKVLGFIKMAGESRKIIFQHGLAFSGGVLLSFWVLAAMLLSLQAYGRSVGWGFQLQEPIFVAILAALLFVFGLSLFGLFEIGTSLISVAGKAQQNSGHRNALVGSFLSGILATAVATPCTGPFLGSAVGFAVTLPAPQAMLIFTSLGLGMSLPYLLLAAFPKLISFLPKPGNWMITFKEIMGFFMLATVLWLVWVFSAQTSNIAVILLLAGFFLLSIAGWVYGKWATPMRKKLTRSIGTLLAAILFLGGGYIIIEASSLTSQEPISGSPQGTNNSEIADAWETFSPKRVAELRKKGVPVFVDFTSKWCLICQANHMVLSTEEVSKKFNALGVVKMKADWTRKDEVITAELRKFGRNSVPLYILYGIDGNRSPEILPQVLTPEALLMSLQKLEKTK